MRRTLIVIAILALAASAQAQAQKTSSSSYRYRWKDASGLPHYSDSLTSDALKYGYDLVNDRGLVVQHVDRQLNPEERAAAQKAAEEQAAKQKAAQERDRVDSQMLAAYPTEEGYAISLKQGLENLDQQIGTTRANLRSQEKALTDLLTRAGDLERAKQPVPKILNDSIAKQRDVVTRQRDTLERELNARDAAEKKNVDDLKHYRDVKAAKEKERSGL
jgi:small-conductance mechanosensitive channel